MGLISDPRLQNEENTDNKTGDLRSELSSGQKLGATPLQPAITKNTASRLRRRDRLFDQSNRFLSQSQSHRQT